MLSVSSFLSSERGSLSINSELGDFARSMNPEKTYHRRGEPGGPTCPVGVLPVTMKGKQGDAEAVELLDAGTEASEVELLRTVASRLGVRWGHDEFGWWAAVRGHDFPKWAVWRQDDSGVRFLIEANLTEDQARTMVADFELKGHKQTYWCGNETIA